MSEQKIDLLTEAVAKLTRIVATAVLNKIDKNALIPEDRAWPEDRVWADSLAAEAENKAQVEQDEINSNHPIEQILGPDYSVRISYAGTGRTYGAGAFPMANFSGFAEVPAGYSLRLSIAKMFAEVAAIESVTITATIPTVYDGEVSVTVDAHRRENRQVAVFSSDGVYKALISIDEVPMPEEVVY
jgi:hypothetical protein